MKTLRAQKEAMELEKELQVRTYMYNMLQHFNNISKHPSIPKYSGGAREEQGGAKEENSGDSGKR